MISLEIVIRIRTLPVHVRKCSVPIGKSVHTSLLVGGKVGLIVLNAIVYSLTMINLAKRIGCRCRCQCRFRRRCLQDSSGLLQSLDSLRHLHEQESQVSVRRLEVLDLGSKEVNLGSHGWKERKGANTQPTWFVFFNFFRKKGSFVWKKRRNLTLIRPLCATHSAHILKLQIGRIGLDINHIPQLGIGVGGAGVLRAGNRLNVGKSWVLESVVVDGNAGRRTTRRTTGSQVRLQNHSILFVFRLQKFLRVAIPADLIHSPIVVLGQHEQVGAGWAKSQSHSICSLEKNMRFPQFLQRATSIPWPTRIRHTQHPRRWQSNRSS